MEDKFRIGQNYYGFVLKERRFVREINAECLLFRHAANGARLLKIMADDDNKTFAIGFKTIPSSDNGVPHIMEHSVLNGSRNFPVKSPFDVLLKGSLSTFLNAFTSKDFTMYPVASLNGRDYFNLMHVYLDAVFNPMIYTDDRIFQQEGWHYELNSPDEPLKYTGVVYNEMKGAFSNPQRELWYQVFRHLFPDNPYGYESGGTPEAITTLTREEFIAFHEKFYHPRNSYIFLYGNADLEEELKFIHQNYLCQYFSAGKDILIEDQPPFGEPHDVTEYYQFLGEDFSNQTFLTYNFVAGQNTDLRLTLALDILCEVLVNQESAPIRLALAEAGVGKDVSASSSNFKQHAVQIAAIKADPDDKQKFLDILMQTLKKVAREGVNMEEVEGVLNRIEFRLREGDDAQKGLIYLNMALPGWFFAGDPFMGLEYEKTLSELRSSMTAGYLEEIINRYFLYNQHTLILTLAPSATLEKERAMQTESELASWKASLTPEQLNNLQLATSQLIDYQQREDRPEDLAKIPLLELSDITPTAKFHAVEETTVAGVPLLSFTQFTQDVVYAGWMFNLKVIPAAQLPYVSLLATTLGSMSTSNYDFGELNKQLNIHTGGFFTSSRAWLEGSDDERMLPKFVVSSKSMNHKTGNMVDLTEEIITRTIFHDRERLKNILMRHHSQLEASMKGSGYQVASRRFASYISNLGAFREVTGGLTYFRFITELLRNFDDQFDMIAGQLQEVATLLFTRENLMATVSCAAADLPEYLGSLTAMTDRLPSAAPVCHAWELMNSHINEGIQAASGVQYVVKGANFKKLNYRWNGKMRVLNQVLSTEWLQNRIRVIGGAYGGFASIARSGNITFSSYRDPNLRETLDNFDQTPEFLNSFTADDQMMTRYIIGTIADLDTPLTPSQKKDQAISWYLAKRTASDLQREREEVLSTTAEDIRSFKNLIADVMNRNIYCVYGNADKLASEEKLFSRLIRIG